MEELRKFFRPELLNRFDEVVIFRPLSKENMDKIVELQIKGLEKLLLEQNIRLATTPDAKTYLSEIGFDPIYGARPLRRTIQRLVENQVSSLLIKGDVVSGDTINMNFDGRELTFKVEKMKEQKTEAQIDKNENKENQLPVTTNNQPKIVTYLCTSCSFRFQSESKGPTPTNCPMCHGINFKEVKETPTPDINESNKATVTPAPSEPNSLDSYFTPNDNKPVTPQAPTEVSSTGKSLDTSATTV